MQPEYAEDLALAAENRRRRRLGQGALEPETFPTLEWLELELTFDALVLKHNPPGCAPLVKAQGALWLSTFEAPRSAGTNARAHEGMAMLLAQLRALLARAQGTREPGEDG